ncbi:MAG: repressor LexA [Gemmatimonadetes bacterium]|nr:repressor LexA [Gemmatimonadota bacterium]
MAEPLTATEKKIYHFLLDFLAENTYQPSVREIGRRFRIKSTKTVSDLLQSLAAKGYIARDASRSRGVRLLGVNTAGGTQPVPVYGDGSAGAHERHDGEPESFITVDRRFLPAEDVFFLKVCGDAMRERGILDGDFVMVNPSARANDGDMIAARLGERPLVRTLTHRGAAIVLEAAAPGEGESTVGPADDFRVMGVVSGVYRPMHVGASATAD